MDKEQAVKLLLSHMHWHNGEWAIGGRLELGELAKDIAQAHEQDKWDALQGVDAAWHEIEDGHLATIAQLKNEMGKARDLLGAAYGLLRRAQEEEE